MHFKAGRVSFQDNDNFRGPTASERQENVEEICELIDEKLLSNC